MHMEDKIEAAMFRLLNDQQGVLGLLRRQHRAIGDPRNTPGQSSHNARLRMTSGVLKRHNLTSPIRLVLLRCCSQAVLFADLLLGCAQALHAVAKAVGQVDRG